MATGHRATLQAFDSRRKISRHSLDKPFPVKVICKSGVMLAEPEVIKDAHLIQLANRLRQSAPKSERLIWPYLEEMGFEHSVPMLGYVVDFYHSESSVAIEIDGVVHRDRKARDRKRDRALGGKGIRVFRFWAKEVYSDISAVVEHIRNVVALYEPRRTA